MKRGHTIKHNTALRRSRRRKIQLKELRRAQHKKRTIYFMLEHNS